MNAMYAVVKTGGKQYRVEKNDVIKVEKIAGEAGSTVSLDTVLMVNDGKASTVGSPLVDGAVVTAAVLEQGRADKIARFHEELPSELPPDKRPWPASDSIARDRYPGRRQESSEEGNSQEGCRQKS